MLLMWFHWSSSSLHYHIVHSQHVFVEGFNLWSAAQLMSAQPQLWTVNTTEIHRLYGARFSHLFFLTFFHINNSVLWISHNKNSWETLTSSCWHLSFCSSNVRTGSSLSYWDIVINHYTLWLIVIHWRLIHSYQGSDSPSLYLSALALLWAPGGLDGNSREWQPQLLSLSVLQSPLWASCVLGDASPLAVRECSCDGGLSVFPYSTCTSVCIWY